jgi:shikimate kinase
MRIYLVGFMGSGKSTIGKRLANNLKFSFIDLDKYIEDHTMKTIPEIFEQKGEAEFRKLENKYLKEVSEIENVIISTGGGVPCFADNMTIMKQQGKIIYLQLDNISLANRLNNSKLKNSRPLIKNIPESELVNFISIKISEREPFYNQADITINTLNFNIDQLVQLVRDKIDILKS